MNSLGRVARFVGSSGIVLALAMSACTPAIGDPESSPIPLVIDTDMAPDDVTAILSLVRDPRVDLRAITVTGTGEAHCPGGMFVARSVLTMVGVTAVPVACGRRSPLGPAEAFPDDWRAGADIANGIRLQSPSFLPETRDAEPLLVDLARAASDAGGRLTILTIGSLTNIAGAVALDPDFAKRVRIVSMLGALDVPGNVETGGPGTGAPTAEWNAHADPTAVRRVLEAGFDLTLVPLDATNDAPLTRELFDSLESDHRAGPADIVYELWARNPFMLDGGFFLWDPLTAAVVRDPTIVQTRTAQVRVIEGDGLDGGRLVEDPAGAPVTVAVSADRAAFETLLLDSLREGPPRDQPFSPVATVHARADADLCDLSPGDAPVPRGLVRFELAWQGEGPAGAYLVALGSVSWSELEAFVAEPDFSNPPPVSPLAGAEVDGPGTGVGYGEVTDGPLALVCVHGFDAEPTILLQGPLEVTG